MNRSHHPISSGPLAAALLLLAPSALAQQPSRVDHPARTVSVTASGAPGRPAWLLADVDGGPRIVAGQHVRLGFTSALVGVPLGPIPASGTLAVELSLPPGPKPWLAVVVDRDGTFAGLDFSGRVTLDGTGTPAELAGNALAQYPFFEFVRAFNRGSNVQVGIDPTRYPSVVGDTADIYVVVSKTRAQWDADPSLLDVAGGPLTVTVSGSTIQANTFTVDTGGLPGPNEAPGSGDTRLGVAYDVVVDLDQNGMLDSADLIDGYDDRIAGFYVMRDLALGSTKTATGQGPYDVVEVMYSGGTFLGQDTYYPANIASLGQLPLVVVSHGNGHQFIWYDHIGYHLASYGYIVMSHENNTVPGSHTAAVTTLTNTDYILANQAAIAGGVLNGHIDSSRIVWIGHSRGADGVARAYDMLFNGFTGSFPSTVTPPTQYTIDDIVLVSSIAPVDFGGFEGASPTLGGTDNGSHPHDANYHLWVGQADADVNGCAGSGDQVLWYHLHDRAIDIRQSISLYGVGHGDFHDGGGSSVASGPGLIGRAETHKIMLGYLLALVGHYVEGDVGARDFLWRQYESFHAVGSSTVPDAHVNLMLQDAPQSRVVIDDFQDAAFDPTTASSGAGVSMTVQDYLEGRLADTDFTYTWQPTDPFNGDTNDSPNNAFRSDSYGAVFSFDGAGDYHITYDLLPAQRDFSHSAYLSFRAAQGTHHPLTVASLGDLTFTVTLEDGDGDQSSIGVGAYGGGIEEPYQRMGCGTGPGWNSEFETIRLRLADFQNNGSDVDLDDVAKVIFRFGPSWGSAQGRLSLDEIELTNDGMANAPPSVVCPPDAVTECNAHAGTELTLAADVSDPDGDPLTVTWEVDGMVVQIDNVPAGSPTTMATVTLTHTFALGAHTVTVTVDDGELSASCTSSQQIVDTTPPQVTCAVDGEKMLLWPPSHDLVDVGLTASVSDACDPNPTVEVLVFGDEDDEEPAGDGNHSPDAKDIALGTLRLRVERKGSADGRVYAIVVKATDTSGNVGFDCCTVVVPKTQSGAALAGVAAQASAAEAACTETGPPGFFVIGDGPILGPKQ